MSDLFQVRVILENGAYRPLDPFDLPNGTPVILSFEEKPTEKNPVQTAVIQIDMERKQASQAPNERREKQS